MIYDRKKTLSISFLIILTTYISGLTRAIKDTLLVSSLGAEILNALKLYLTLPVSVILMLTYTKLLEKYKNFTVYHIANLFFICFFIIFALFLYPNREVLHMDFNSMEVIKFRKNWPSLEYFLVIIGNWTYSLFYVFCELWSNVMMMILFWQMMNKVTDIKKATTLYPFLILIGQIGAIASGITINYCSNIGAEYGWSYTMNYTIAFIVFASLIVTLNLFHLSYFIDFAHHTKAAIKAENNSITGSVLEDIKSILSSRYTLLIMSLTICYAFSYNLIATLWKSIVIASLPDPIDYGRFMGQIQSISAIVSILFMIISTYLIKFISWRAVSLITPVVTFLSAITFFACVIFYNTLYDKDTEISGFSVLTIAIILGAIQNVLSRSCTAFFNPAKEIAFIPISEPNRSIAKGMEMVASRFGKAGGALIQFLMLNFILESSLLDLAPNIMIIFVLVILVWIFSVMSLSTEFNNKIR